MAGLQEKTDKGDLAIDIGRQVEWKKENKYRAKYYVSCLTVLSECLLTRKLLFQLLRQARMA